MRRPASFPSILVLAGAVMLAAYGMAAFQPALAQQSGTPAAQPSGGALDERILRLEERIQDLQAVIGTLQSFIRDGAAAPAQGAFPQAGGQPENANGGGPSEVNIRVLALETQIRALTGQMEQITKRLGQMAGGGGAPSQPPVQQPLDQTQPAAPQLRQSVAPAVNPLARVQPPQPVTQDPVLAPQFGTTATLPQPAYPYDKPPAQTRAPAQGRQIPPLAGLSGAGIPGAGEGPRAMYEASYQDFLRSDFGVAENGFRSFIATYASDPLIGNAYYWLGRTHFERGEYEPAAKAFLAGYKKNKKSTTAPDSLLHLGFSLVQLGEKGAACSTLAAVSKQYPDAPEKLKADAAAASKRAGC